LWKDIKPAAMKSFVSLGSSLVRGTPGLELTNKRTSQGVTGGWKGFINSRVHGRSRFGEKGGAYLGHPYLKIVTGMLKK